MNTLNDNLCEAAYKGHVQMVKHLISMGADVNGRNWANSTPLHQVALRLAERDGIRVDESDLEIIKTLLSRGADPNAENRHGSTPRDHVRESRIAGALAAFDDAVDESTVKRKRRTSTGHEKGRHRGKSGPHRG